MHTKTKQCNATYFTAVSAQVLFGMRPFLLSSRGDANAPARSWEQPAAIQDPSILEQSANPITSICVLTVWLEAQGDESGSPELGRLRAAVTVLAQSPEPKLEDVRPLCSAWVVVQEAKRRRRPLAMLIAELRQAVLAEGCRLHASGLATQLGGSSSSEIGEGTSAAQPGSIASCAEQPESIKAVPSRIVRAVGSAIG